METKDAPLGEAQWSQYSVLVVDGEPGMVSFLQRALASRCGVVDVAQSVEAAEPMLRRRLYDLIVLDIALPDRSGIECLHQLRDEGFAGDVVLMTAYADLDTAIDALRAGAVLPAHGVEAVCEWCEMRGLCRRDYHNELPR